MPNQPKPIAKTASTISGTVIVQGVSLACSAAWCAVAQKGQRNLAHGIEGGQEGGRGQGHEDHPVSIPKSLRQDFVLGPEAGGQDGKTRQREATDQEGPEGAGHFPTQPTHVEHILGVHLCRPYAGHRAPCHE